MNGLRAVDAQQTGYQRRIAWLAVVLTTVGLVLLGRIVWWQVVPHPEIGTLVPTGSETANIIAPARGNILDANGQYLAASTVYYTLGVSPRLLDDSDRQELIPILATLLNKSEAEMAEALSKEGVEYVLLGRNLPATIGQQIEALERDGSLNMDAFRLEPTFGRVYPDGELAAHVLGFMNLEGQAHYGLEQYYDRLLRGVEGTWRGISDSWGEQILASLGGYQPARDGADLVLTIDRNVQYMAEQILREGVAENGAAAATMVVVDPRTGGLLAVANQPTYNPNTYGEAESQESYINQAITSLYEPGSTFKVFTLAAALQERVILPTDTYDDRGEIIVGNQKIQNSDKRAHGQTTMTELLAYSRNVGAAHVASLLGATRFYEAMRRFGIGDVTRIDLALEQKGIMRVPTDLNWHMSDLGTNSYGQGIAVTPLQITMAYAAIANDGVLMRPYVVSEVRQEGSVEVREPSAVRRVLSSEVAQQMTEMMADAVEMGMQKAMVPGYRMAGKSGTAGIPDAEGYKNRFVIASFVGFGPVPDPRFVILVKYEKPQEGYWGVDVAAPTFARMAEFLLDYYGIPPTQGLAE
jgi:cell division protein FtsI/penicillin-binding protein 2